MTARTIWDLLLAVLATTFFTFALIADDAVARETGINHREPAALAPDHPERTSADEPRPAARLGTWARSRGYARVTPELGDALAEGAAPDATTREWSRCWERGNGAVVICPDGYVEVN